jgi:hypothetical protein
MRKSCCRGGSWALNAFEIAGKAGFVNVKV